jgi:hypothetical protein
MSDQRPLSGFTRKGQAGENSRDHVGDKLVGRDHRLLEKVDDNRIEPVSKLRVTLEGRLPAVDETQRVSLPIPANADASTHGLDQQLSENPDQLVVNKLTTSQGRLFQSTDLLLDNDLESGRADEERRRGTLRRAEQINLPTLRLIDSRFVRLTAELYSNVLISPSLFWSNGSIPLTPLLNNS